jgi:hypothetical protein
MLARYEALQLRLQEIGDEVERIDAELDRLHAALHAAGCPVRRYPECRGTLS